MNESLIPGAATERKPALQPFSFRGVALYADNPFRRIFFAQFVTALAIAALLAWLIAIRYLPVVTHAISLLPDKAGLHSGVLVGIGSPIISGHKFFSIAAKSDTNFSPGNTADLQLRFHEQTFEIYSLAGWISFPYDPRISINLSRGKAEPWWGAWKPILVGLSGLCFLVWLYLSWRILSLLYMPVVKGISWFANREVTWIGASRLCSAALLPGAVFLALSIFSYGLQFLSLPALAVCFVVHFIVGWVYAAGAVYFLPRQIKETDFSSVEDSPPDSVSHIEEVPKPRAKAKSKSNPFSTE